MPKIHKDHPLRIFAISGLITAALGAVMFYYDGIAGLWLYTILVLLEVTFSFDNAVINSKILIRLSPMWQTLFLTVGIFIAVFVVRFLLPVLIVMITTGLGAANVVDLALNHPEEYGHELEQAGPLIEAFGGTFLVMISIYYFIDRQKHVHWVPKLEKWLQRAANIRFIQMVTMVSVAILLYLTVDEALRNSVFIASLFGIALHVGLQGTSKFFEHRNSNSSSKHLVGMAAFSLFMYLQVLDASFSFDGVIGAFAITTSVLLIMAGLGAGALWVRSFTVYMVRTGTLAKYRYLEHGAHWAIFALGLVMLAKLYYVHPPEWLTGSLGLIFISIAVASSILERKGQRTHE